MILYFGKSAVNPLIYGWKNRDFRLAFARLLRYVPCKWAMERSLESGPEADQFFSIRAGQGAKYTNWSCHLLSGGLTHPTHQMTCSKWRRRSPWLEINKWRICNHHPPHMLTHKSSLNWNSNIVQSIPKKWRRMLSAIYFLTGSAALNSTILSQSVLNVNCFPFVLRQLNRCWNNSGACMTCQIWYREIIFGKHVAHSYRSPVFPINSSLK